MKSGTEELLKFKKLTMRMWPGEVWKTRGILDALWSFAARNAPGGDVGRFCDDDIGVGIGYVGDMGELVQALLDGGWLDGHEVCRFVIHDWWDHCENTVHRKLARGRKLFADGSAPKLTGLGRDEKEGLEEFYSSQFPVSSSQLTGNGEEGKGKCEERSVKREVGKGKPGTRNQEHPPESPLEGGPEDGSAGASPSQNGEPETGNQEPGTINPCAHGDNLCAHGVRTVETPTVTNANTVSIAVTGANANTRGQPSAVRGLEVNGKGKERAGPPGQTGKNGNGFGNLGDVASLAIGDLIKELSKSEQERIDELAGECSLFHGAAVKWFAWWQATLGICLHGGVELEPLRDLLERIRISQDPGQSAKGVGPYSHPEKALVKRVQELIVGRNKKLAKGERLSWPTWPEVEKVRSGKREVRMKK